MSGLTLQESTFIGLCFGGFFYGLYSGIFVMYLRYSGASKENAIHRPTWSPIFYPLCTLYILSLAIFILDMVNELLDTGNTMYMISGILIGCCDFISQCSLIFRCWIVWNRNIRVLIIPSMLALAFLGTWLVPIGSFHISPHLIVTTNWGPTKILATCLAISLTVNVLVTGLIIFRIFRMSPLSHHNSRGDTLRSIIFILVESGMTLFSIQLARLVLTFLSADIAIKLSQPIVGMHQMLIGITPTIIQVLVLSLSSITHGNGEVGEACNVPWHMGSFHDEESMTEELMTEVTRIDADPDYPSTETGSIRNFYYFNSIPETGSTSIVRQETQCGIDIDRAFGI